MGHLFHVEGIRFIIPPCPSANSPLSTNVACGGLVLGLALPVTIALLPLGESQSLYREGFRFAALAVVWTMMSGSLVAIFQRMPEGIQRRQPAEPAPQPTGGDG